MFKPKTAKVADDIKAIDKMYADHLESVEMSGVPFDRVGLMREWAMAVTEAETPGKPEDTPTA